MYARLLAFVCLLGCSVLIVRAESSSTRGATVGVYLQTDDNASSLSIQAMRLELRDLMVPTGLNLAWTNARNSARVDRLIMVELRGTCQAEAATSGKYKNRTPLASTAVTDGKVLPFTKVDCNALNQFLRSELAKRPAADRDEIYGRALARLLAHEFYHVLTETEEHTSSGISKKSFSTADLLANTFMFEPSVIAQLHIEQATPAMAAEETEEAAFDFDLGLDLFEDAFTAR